jgi:hypothetical protein
MGERVSGESEAGKYAAWIRSLDRPAPRGIGQPYPNNTLRLDSDRKVALFLTPIHSDRRSGRTNWLPTHEG